MNTTPKKFDQTSIKPPKLSHDPDPPQSPLRTAESAALHRVACPSSKSPRNKRKSTANRLLPPPLDFGPAFLLRSACSTRHFSPPPHPPGRVASILQRGHTARLSDKVRQPGYMEDVSEEVRSAERKRDRDKDPRVIGSEGVREEEDGAADSWKLTSSRRVRR